MSYRKITVANTEYEYTVGDSCLKVKGIKEVLYFDKTGSVAVSPSYVKRFIETVTLAEKFKKHYSKK